MRQIVVTLQDGVEPEDTIDIMDRLMNVKGVHSVAEIERIKFAQPAADRCPNTPWLFGDADTLQQTERINGT